MDAGSEPDQRIVRPRKIVTAAGISARGLAIGLRAESFTINPQRSLEDRSRRAATTNAGKDPMGPAVLDDGAREWGVS